LTLALAWTNIQLLNITKPTPQVSKGFSFKTFGDDWLTLVNVENVCYDSCTFLCIFCQCCHLCMSF